MNEELRVIITAEIDNLRRNVQNAQDQVEDFSKEGKASFEKFQKAASTAGKAVGGALKVAGAAVLAAGAALVGLSESTAEYRAEQAKLVTAFEAAGSTAEQAKDTYNDLYRVLGDSGQATEAAQHLAKLTTNEKDLAEWTNICQGVYATFGESLPIESLTEAINETAKTGEVTGALADAVNWAGVSEDEFAEALFWCNTEAEREELIRNTLNGLYDEAATKYEENAASILAANEAQAALTASLAALGEAVTPIVTILKGSLAEVLTELAPQFKELSQGIQDIVNGVDGGAERMSESITAILNTIVVKITELLPTLLTVGVQVIGALIQGLVTAFPQIVEALAIVIPLIITTLADLLPQVTGAILSALPLIIEVIILAAASVIEALGEILPQVVTQIIDIIPQVVSALVENIPILLEAAIGFFMAIAEALPVVLPQLIEELPQIVDSVLDMLIDNLPVLLDATVAFYMALVDAIPEIIPVIVEALPQIIDSIIGAVIDMAPILLTAAFDSFMAIVYAIPRIIPSLITGLVQIVSQIRINLVQRIDDLLLSTWNSIVGIFGRAGEWFGNIFSGAVNGIKNAFSGVVGFFKGIFDKIKSTFSNIGSTIGNGIKETVSKAINSVLSSAVKIINGFIKAINAAIGVINLIPGVNISKITQLSVPKMAKGGIVDGATLAMIGENGKEAVMPLENNTEWIDKLATRLSDMIGSDNTPIVLQVDGKTFAQTSINSINKLTKQTGYLALNLV